MPDRFALSSQAALQPRLELDEFEGPLELLLTLIEQHRLPITRVSLAQVADQYLAQVRALPELNADLLADFLAIAGKLLLLKSRALLLVDEPDPVAEEAATDLEERLATYRIFRAAAEHLHALEQQGRRTYPATREPVASATPAPLAPITPQELLATLKRLHAAAVPRPAEPALAARVGVDEKAAHILQALRSLGQVPFRDVAGASVDEVIATFLAVLELFRRGLAYVKQPTPYGDLLITPP